MTEDLAFGDLSLGELQSLCVKATRGADRAVGVAEDAGRAVRWLCARGDDGAGALAALLRVTDGKAASVLLPDLPWFTPVQEAICPLLLGGYLSDMALVPDGPIGPVWAPLLLEPFVADLRDTGVEIVTGGPQDHPAAVRLVPRSKLLNAVRRTRATVDVDTMRTLLTFAARTYAPATEESRAKGAGAGLADND